MTHEITLLFSPRSAQEAAEILRACSAAAAAGRRIRAGIVESPFRPAGGIEPLPAPSSVWEIGTAGAAQTLVLLGHDGMSEIHEISRSDLLAVAGGGVKFGAFADEVRKAGLYFPHEPDALTRNATIAELVMGAEVFATDGRFGNLREYVLSLELVTPKGEIVRTGSRSVKDVTGYNIAGFRMGCGGLCGMIAKATLRLLPAPGTRFHFLCMGSRSILETLAGEIHRRFAPASLELFPYSGSAAARANLIGELQSAVLDREEALFGAVSALAPAEAPAERLEPAALEAYRHFPMLAIESMEKGRPLLHTALGIELVSAHRHDLWSRMSFFPARFHYYFSADSSAARELGAAGASAGVESIEMRDGSVFRKRLTRDEIAGLTGGGRIPESTAAGELDRRIYRVFDPRGIMLP
ncbi:MAG: FAD-binding oxidoreductase [Candidatus Krumholzibacteria bacterium]|nr:FAD-binding oxidoreductase [Candidatus Krumholzibacteria bacterium]